MSLIFLLFAALAAAFLSPVLFSDRALLPTDYLMRMSPWAPALPPAAPGTAARPEPAWDPILWDAIAQFYPWRAFTAHWLRCGILPFWDPHQFCGTPFLANSQSAPLYPLHLLLLGFIPGLPVARAMALLAAIHLTLAGFLMFLWLQKLRLSSFAAALGGMAFMFSGFAVTWLELPSFLTVACWLPLLFLTLHRALEAPTGPRAAGVAVAVGLLLLGGHLQIAFYCLLGAGLYGLGTLAQRLRVRSARRAPFLSFAGCLLPALILGLMLAAPQLLPAVELSRHSHRIAPASDHGYELYLRNAMPAAQLVRLFLPDFYGNPTRGRYDAGSPADYTEFCAFIGGVGLLLALAGLLAGRRRPRETVPAASLAVLSLLLALGTPLNRLLYFGVPGFSQSGSPARVLVLFCFAGAWLAALGAEALTEVNGMRVQPAAILGPAAPIAPAVEGLPERSLQAASEGGTRAYQPPEGCPPASRVPAATTEDGDEPGERSGYDGPGSPSASLHDLQSGPSSTPSPPRRGLALTTRWLPVTALGVWLLGLAGALLAARHFVTSGGVDISLFLARSGPALELAVVSALLAVGVPAGLERLARSGSISASLAGTLGRAVLAALLLGELWFYGAGFNPTGPLASVYPAAPLIDALRAGPAAGPGRVLPLNHHWSLTEPPPAVLPPNAALALGLMDPQGYDSLFIGRYKGLTNLLVPTRDSAPPQNGNMLFLWDPHAPLVPLLAADRIVSREEIASGGKPDAVRKIGGDAQKIGAPWPLLYDQAGLRVYRYPAALPRAFVASTWLVERDEAAITQDLLAVASAGRLGTTALVEGSGTAGGATGRGGPAEVEDMTPNEAGVTLGGGTTPGLLVLLDNYYPGWHATDAATGSPLRVHRADFTFRGIEVAKGTRTIRLRYEPAAFRFGLFLALLVVAAIAAICAAAKPGKAVAGSQ